MKQNQKSRQNFTLCYRLFLYTIHPSKMWIKIVDHFFYERPPHEIVKAPTIDIQGFL